MDDFDLEQQAIQARRQRAAALRGSQMPDGRMVGNVYVRPSFAQYLATGLKQYAGAKDEQSADDELRGLGEKRRSMERGELEAIAGALRGTPAKPAFDVPANEMGEGFQMNPVQAQPGSAEAMYARALQSPMPDLRKMGMQGIGQQAQFAAQQKAAQDEADRKAAVIEAERRRVTGILQQTQGNPQAALAAGVPVEMVKAYYDPGLGKSKLQFVNGVPVDPYAGTAQGPAIPQQAPAVNPRSDLLIPGPDGTLVPNQALIGAKSKIAGAGASRVNVDARNFNTQESEQSKTYGKGLGEVRTAINQAGFDAPGKLARLSRMEDLLKGIDGGAAAPAIADVASFAQSLGIKIDPKLGDKQAAEALAREMAGTLRQPGTGPMTDKDFDNFLRQVPSLSKTAEGRAEIMKTMRGAIERDMRAAKYAREYAKANNGVIDDNFFDSLAEFYAQNPVVTPKMPAANARGQAFSDPDKEKRYQEYVKKQGRP